MFLALALSLRVEGRGTWSKHCDADLLARRPQSVYERSVPDRPTGSSRASVEHVPSVSNTLVVNSLPIWLFS